MTSTYRLGLIVPSSNTTMETELPAILHAREESREAERFTFHAARVRMRNVTAEELRAMIARPYGDVARFEAAATRLLTSLASAAPDAAGAITG